MRMAIRQVRAAWPRGCPSVMSSAADMPDKTAEIDNVDGAIRRTVDETRLHWVTVQRAW